MGRPKKELDWVDIEKLCVLQCTLEEIAQFCECCVETIDNHAKEKFGLSFVEYFAEKRGTGKISLRRAQWQAAHKGNPTMLIWLGKQYLGQKDRSWNEHSGVDGKPIEMSAMPDEELTAKIEKLLAKKEIQNA